MHLFVSQYNSMLKVRDADEQREEHVTHQKRRLISVGAPIEFHAARIYTRIMFTKFSGELYASGRFAAFEAASSDDYIVKTVMETSDSSAVAVNHTVKCMDNGTFYKCDCGMYEHVGMPCRHILKVLVHTNATEIPIGNICNRWTVSARAPFSTGPRLVGDGAGERMTESARKSLLFIATMDLLNTPHVSTASFEVTMRAISEAKHALQHLASTGEATVNDNQLGGDEAGRELAVPVSLQPPAIVRPRGRPCTVRPKSRLERYGNKRGRSVAAEVARPDTEPIDILNVQVAGSKREIRCSRCGEAGHNRATCGRKRTRV
ncbi:unnamed protein product [Urochloa humidicola]